MQNLDGNSDETKAASVALFEHAWKTGASLFKTDDPVESALEIFGKNIVQKSLSKASTFQCAGLIGVIVTSVAPQVSILSALKHFL